MQTCLLSRARRGARLLRVAFAISMLLPALTWARAGDAETSSPRYRLEASRIEPAPNASARFTVSARFAPQASVGELREGDHFALIGRFAKASVGCGAGDLVFKNGFESP